MCDLKHKAKAPFRSPRKAINDGATQLSFEDEDCKTARALEKSMGIDFHKGETPQHSFTIHSYKPDVARKKISLKRKIAV